MSKFAFAVRRGPILKGEAQYVTAESSFDFERGTPTGVDDGGLAGFTSLLVGTLQIEVDIERRTALHVWGYHPRETWVFGVAVPSPFHSDEVVITSDNNLIPGVSLALAEIGEWTTTYDKNSGWVYVCANPLLKDDQTVLIATNTLLGLIGDSLNSIWIKPVFL